MEPMIRAASLRGFGPLVERLGADPADLMRRCGIDPSSVARDDELIGITAHDRMLDLAAVELACPDLGLRLAGAQDLSVLGPLAYAIGSSETVEDALACASRFLFVHSPALRVELQPDPSGDPSVVAVTYRKDLAESQYSPQGIELGIGVLHAVARTLTGDDDGELLSVLLSHPPQQPVQRYLDHFGSDVRFDAPVAGLRVRSSVLQRSFADASPTIRAAALAHLEATYPDPAASVASRVRAAVLDAFRSDPPTAAAVAARIGLHQRTMQRRLEAEGTTFSRVVDEARRDTVTRLLTTTDLSMTRISLMVGFTEQSTLTHVTRRWHGASPREVRRSAADRTRRGMAGAPTLLT